MVTILNILCYPRHPGSLVTICIRTHCGDQSFCPRSYHKPASKSNFLIPEQPQRKAYSEVLITGDLSEEDIRRAGAGASYLRTDPYTAEFVHGNDTVYFAQPSPSQFISGGSGAGTFNPAPAMGLKDPLNNTLALKDRNTPKNDTGAILRYAHRRPMLA